MLAETEDFSQLSAEDIMSKNPKSITINAMAIEAMEIMDKNEISKARLANKSNLKKIIELIE